MAGSTRRAAASQSDRSDRWAYVTLACLGSGLLLLKVVMTIT